MAKRRAKVTKPPKVVRVANNLRVSLDMSTDPWTVVIDASGGENVLKRSANVQVIKWYLVGNAAAGKFIRHQWLTKIPRGTFGPFLIDEGGGKRATMCDLYDADGKRGDYPYKLTIELAGNQYSSAVVTVLSGNPNIKNNT
jgi:hypothetical protein